MYCEWYIFDFDTKTFNLAIWGIKFLLMIFNCTPIMAV
jgi:hypothetical protein